MPAPPECLYAPGMDNRSSFALLLTLTLPTLALAGCSSSISSGSGGSTSSSGDSTTSTSSAGGAGGEASSSGSTGGAATSSSSSSGSSSSGSGSSSSGSSSSSGGGLCSGPVIGLPAGAACTPADASCHSATSECLPVHDNAGAGSFGLRIAQLKLTAPLALTTGILSNVVSNAITPNNAQCNLAGSGTFSWLLAFDDVAGTLKTGGAKPALNPALGYSFLSENFPITGGTLPLDPVTLAAPLDAGCTATSSAANLNLPVYLDTVPSQAVLLPLRQVRFSSLTVSGDHNCIGKFNAAGLSPADNCAATQQTPAFFPGGQVDGFINLEQADSVVISPIQQTLCVVIAGDATIYGDGGVPAKCKRANGKINFAGDWCTATNQAATAQCNDAVHFAGAFAASGVIIN
jgi:hypothetical protein